MLHSSSEARRENSASLEFTFDERVISAKQGDSIASALIHAGIYEFKENAAKSPRGIFCGMGVCNECTVEIEGEGEKLACMTAITQGKKVKKKSAYPIVEIFDNEVFEALPESELFPDLLVIGAGPSGLACASIAAESGLKVLIIDERSKLGGQYFKQPADAFLREEYLDDQFRSGRALIERTKKSGAEILSGASVWGVFASDYVIASNEHQRFIIRAKKLVLSTGAYERGLFAPGWTIPGVMTTGAAQTLLRSYNVRPGERTFISGNGPLNIQMAAELIRSGGKVVGLAESARPFSVRNALSSLALFWYSPSIALKGLGYLWSLYRAKVPMHTGSVITEFNGDSQVREITLSEIDGAGFAKKGTTQTISVDSVAIGFGFLPSNEIARSLGCKHDYDERSQSLHVTRDMFGVTTIPDVYVVGDAGGISGAQVAQAGGVLAASHIVKELKGGLGNAFIKELDKAKHHYERNLKFQKWLWRIFDAPTLIGQLTTDETIICRCLSLTRSAIREGLSDEILTAGALKRVTRAGMGMCQGRYCGTFAVALTEEKLGESPDQFSGFASQVPYKPTSIGLIAQPEQK